MRLLRLRGRKVCDRVQRQGAQWRGAHMSVRWLAGAPRHPSSRPGTSGLYAGTVASAKLDKSAVNRNRMRRRCREALRTVAGEFPSGSGSLQLLIAPRSSSLKAPFTELQNDIRLFLTSHAPRPETR